jgi:DNA-binding NtrC family response regulator
MPRGGVGTPRILLVDDEALVLAALGRSLGRKTSLRTAQSAKIAFDILGREPFDAIVSDYLMPDVDGLALLTLVRPLYPTMRRILVSAGTVPDLPDHLASGLVEAFLEKPFTEKDLLAVLAR